ncbi:MAG: hypothetical protein N3A38_10115 [Planctomycetota bacterium]|nr:hypothetical protein [Planctomycetota bacterium]
MTDDEGPEGGPPAFGCLMRDFLLEYSRKFLFEVLRGAPSEGGGDAVEISRGREVTAEWTEWCARHGAEMERLTAGIPDEKLKSLYEEILGFMAFVALRICGSRGLPVSAAAGIANNLPASPFGPFEPGKVVARYSRSPNPHVAFAESVSGIMEWPESSRPRLIMVAATIARFTGAVMEDAAS